MNCVTRRHIRFFYLAERFIENFACLIWQRYFCRLTVSTIAVLAAKMKSCFFRKSCPLLQETCLREKMSDKGKIRSLTGEAAVRIMKKNGKSAALFRSCCKRES